ncbi:hypothetical protein P9239_15500 [Caballeronia sp. LZ062]|uniref:hypothetical protein n=1 Tax=unclassified Caballeronia TaxID=2646786 RepID=UPI00285AA451|nr:MULTISPECIES: hypothetical protein [unclassified Caballeronia]MDR5853719.1 hypothetical protein [Caballeronia sp. LZ050]MDR5871748.1 hypothetical protein [Caballeronia sp. LZ062]
MNPADSFLDSPDFIKMSAEVVEARRMYNGRRLWRATNGVVQHGLLKGYFLGERATWRYEDTGTKLVGLYELEVCELIRRIHRGRSTFIDLGAADGFYGIGLVSTGVFERSICYEIDEASRDNLRNLANERGVGDRVNILGAVTSTFADELSAHGVDFKDCVLLCDIEGHEFETLTRECLRTLRHAHVIVEIHDFMIVGPDRHTWLPNLVARASDYFNVTEIKAGARDLTQIPLIADNWTDSDRWLLCSEGRAKPMTWLHFEPKSNPQAV